MYLGIQSRATGLKKARKCFFQLMYVSGQLNEKKFMVLVTETNYELPYDRDVKVSFETFYDKFVAMITRPSKLSFLNISLKLTA